MGAQRPKSVDVGGLEDERGPFEILLDKMQYAINDAIHSGKTNDPILAILLEMTIPALRDKRPLFPSLVDEPVLYRHFCRFAKETLDEITNIEAEMGKAIDGLFGGA